VKLLFDQNLSPKLVDRISDHFPESQHVRDAGLSEASDREVWDFALSNGFAIVSKDSDFVQLSLLAGAPPKVIRLQVGNCTTDRVEPVLRSGFEAIASFERNADASLLVLPQARRITSP
jgi:predicted nuclease of predicted toxin-antitoxin system